jgi:hypothetical protein
VALEVGDELGHRLLGDLRPLGEHAHARAAVVQVLEDVAVSRAHVGVPALREALRKQFRASAKRLPQEDREVLRGAAGRCVGESIGH